MSRPWIGITPDLVQSPKGTKPDTYELRAAYAEAVLEAGGIPIVLPLALQGEALAEVVGQLKGLLLTGGPFDIPPGDYGEAPHPATGPIKPARTAFERAALGLALQRDLPVLGICAGMQLINVQFGGKLYQHLPEELPGTLAHEQPDDRRQPSHPVRVLAGTLLAKTLAAGETWVNSSHHQGVRVLGAGLTASAFSPDGLIEALEAPGHRFLVGVQWHPELLIRSTPIQLELFRSLLDAARR
jgi:putative glutamine amidotransferase